MAEAAHLVAVERLVASLYPRAEQLLSSFMYGRPGAPHWERRLGTEIYINRKEYLDAVLFIRRHGSAYLRAISIGDLRSMVTEFVTENFWYIGGRNFLSRSTVSYGTTMDASDKIALAEALAASPMFHPGVELTLYPLIPIQIMMPFDGEHFVLAAPDQFSHSHVPPGARPTFDPSLFPPFVDWDGVRRPVSSWLGVRSPLRLLSDKMASAILGAVALTPLPRKRHQFSGRQVFGGKCTVAARVTTQPGGEAHTPPMMDDIVLTAADHPWLTKLDTLLGADDRVSRSQLRALEYFYRAWFLDPRERFAPMCMALDALLAVDRGHTAAAIKFVKSVVEPSVDEARLRLLMRVRGAVIHGAAPDVYDSENYEQYWREYGTDPIRDLELLVAKGLRVSLFGDDLSYHADIHAATIAGLQASGRLPRVLEPGTIIPPEL